MDTKNFSTEIPPTVEYGAVSMWQVHDDLGNPVAEGEQVFVLENGATIHVDATEDYLLEKLNAKVADFENWEGNTEMIFVFPNGTWMREADIEDYFIEVLGAQVFERKALLPKQK